MSIWNDHRFQICQGWATGDFNGNGASDVSDFNIWNMNKFLTAATTQASAGRLPRSTLPVASVVIPSPLVARATDRSATHDTALEFKQLSQLEPITDTAPQLAVVDPPRSAAYRTVNRTQHSQNKATDEFFAEIEEWKAGSTFVSRF